MEKIETLKSNYNKFHNAKYVVKVRELLLIFLGLFPYAVAVNQLLVPSDIVGSGLTGLCEIIYFATKGFVPIWLSSLIFNVILLVIAFKLIDFGFVLRTIWGVFSFTFWLKIVPVASEPFLHDPFMVSVVGGMLCGCGLGIVFMNNGTSGGTDIVAMIVNRYHHIPIGRVLFYCDLVIISSAYFLPNVRSVEKVLLGLCFTFMCTNVVDMIMNKVRQSVQFFIFSTKYDQIANAINSMPRGVTILNGQGWYSKQEIHVVTVLAKKSESSRIFNLVREIDPDAFISQSEVIGVYGRGFDPINK